MKDAYLAYPEKTGPGMGIVLIHEVWGLTDHIKDMANRFASQGYVVLAPDLLAGTGIMEKITPELQKEIWDPATRDEAQKKMRAAMAPIQAPEFAGATVAKLKECVSTLLADKNVNGKVAVVGFCFGGTYSFALAVADHRIVAAVPFYGHAPEPMDPVKEITGPVLAFYGEKDERLMAQLPELKKKMQEYGKEFEAVVYPETGHAFMNDTNPRTYKKEAAADAWKKTLEFLGKR